MGYTGRQLARSPKTGEVPVPPAKKRSIPGGIVTLRSSPGGSPGGIAIRPENSDARAPNQWAQDRLLGLTLCTRRVMARNGSETASTAEREKRVGRWDQHTSAALSIQRPQANTCAADSVTLGG